MTPTEIEPEMVAVDCAKAALQAANVAIASTFLLKLQNNRLIFRASFYVFVA
jgi:hypothetical protein